METLHSSLSPQDKAFKRNFAHLHRQVEVLRARLTQVRTGGSAQAHARQQARHKLFVRERIRQVLDVDSPFLEIGALAAFGRYDEPVPSAGIVCGLGHIAARLCMVVGNDATVKGGTYFPETVKKHLRAQQIARQNRLPCVYLVDSGGIFLPLQSEAFADKDHFGRIFYNQAVMSAQGIPQIAVVLGMCTAGGAYVPAMADENIIVRDNGTIYLAGPPLVQAATGEEVSAEELGGGPMHTRISGVCDHLADNEAHALQLARDAIAHCGAPQPRLQPEQPPEAPLHAPQDIYGAIPADSRQPYDVHEVLARLLDGSRFHAFKATYGPTLVCGFGHIMGFAIGLVASNGVLFGQSALKGAHFVQLCEQRRIPLLFLQNVTGFMVGKNFEQGGIAKDGAKMVQAVASATVPKITIVIGASHGAGNYAMCGRGSLPNFMFLWPTAKVSVMGASQAAAVLLQVKQREGPLDEAAQAAIAAPVVAKYDKEADPYHGSSLLWDDGIIDPAHTREVVALALGACLPPNPQAAGRQAPVFRM